MLKDAYLQELSSEDLSDILFHTNQKGIKRLISKNFPVHLAIHNFNCSDIITEKYVEPHFHDHPEINIILPLNDNLTYEIQIGDKDYIIEKPSAVWIPKGIMHSANLRRGKGFFICIILANEYEAQS